MLFVVEDPIGPLVEVTLRVVSRPTQVLGGISVLPMLVANLEMVGDVVVSRSEDVTSLKNLLGTIIKNARSRIEILAHELLCNHDLRYVTRKLH